MRLCRCKLSLFKWLECTASGMCHTVTADVPVLGRTWKLQHHAHCMQQQGQCLALSGCVEAKIAFCNVSMFSHVLARTACISREQALRSAHFWAPSLVAVKQALQQWCRSYQLELQFTSSMPASCMLSRR